MKSNTRPFTIRRRRAAKPDLQFIGIVSGTIDRLVGVIDDRRITAVLDKSKRATEYRLYCEWLPRKQRSGCAP